MKIGGFDINLPKINKSTNANKPLANLNEPIQDTFTSSKKINKVSEKEALKQVSEMKNADGKPRFSKKEVEDFKISNSKGEIDLDTVKAFKDNTNFDMDNMKAVYQMGKELKDKNFNEKVLNAISKCSDDFMPEFFKQSVYEPLKEFSLENDLETRSYKFDAKNSDMISKSTYKTDFGNEVTECEDYKNNTVTTKITEYDYDKKQHHLLAQTVVQNDKDGKVLKEEEMTPSDIDGIYDVKYTYPNGKTKQISKGSIDKKSGIVSIKKDMTSENGTRTQYLYEDDPKGNRIIDYKITNKNGKILMGISQSFEVVNDNHFISSKNGYKYDIKTDDKKLTVKDLHHDKEVSIDFEKKLVGDNKKGLVELLKKVPGQELFEAVENVNKIQSSDTLDSCFSPIFKNLKAGNDLYAFLHELGHAKDAQTQKTSKDLVNNENQMFTGNKDIQETYLKEREAFNKTHSDEEREHIRYFTQAKGHYQGEFGGLSEIVAETNAILNSRLEKQSECLGPRFQYVQQHFPETIAKIADLMNWKDDLTAIEYYGT